MSIRGNIRAEIADLNGEIKRQKSISASEIARLESEKKALEDTLGLISNDLELVLVDLKKKGLLKLL